MIIFSLMSLNVLGVLMGGFGKLIGGILVMSLSTDARKKKTPKIILCVRERERERERGRRNNLFVMENYAKNGRENNKFIEDDVNMKRQNKGK